MKGLPDYPSMKQLAAALWQKNNAYHGAAVMVGAGFSRSASSAGNSKKKLPLWNDLSKKLADDLSASSGMDPLRLAEEYRAYFGTQALHDLVKKEINDASWSPGELHRSLLELPWTEVLTTNWDTLLERASLKVHQPQYNVVSRQEDLSRARSPRIVKLHGTVNTTTHLIFTQEDYRRYPSDHAAFVNFGRQVFIENELCLLGFSGDDPNFLQWAGWVRDQLKTSVRRIYLVGALDLTAAKRKYLESLNVAPIDLGALVNDYDDHDAKHAEASRIFLSALKELKPKQSWEWTPTQITRSVKTEAEVDLERRDPAHAALRLEQQLVVLEADRLSYPGWLICPAITRWMLQHQISDPFPSKLNLSEMKPDSRAKLLYELVWRNEITFQLTPAWLINEMVEFSDPGVVCSLSKRQQLEILLHILKNSRWLDSAENEMFNFEAEEIFNRYGKYWPECKNELIYWKALKARDRFDYVGLSALVEGLSISDPVWGLRKASLLAELGRFEEGEGLISSAYQELLIQYRNDKNSIFIFSRLAWAHWLLRGVELWRPGKDFEEFPSYYKESKCSPWDYIENLKQQVSKVLESQQKRQMIEPSFSPGRYKNNADSIVFNNELHPFLLLQGISSSVGMALRWKDINLLTEPAARLADIDDLDENVFALAVRVAHSDSSEVLKKTFSRTLIARLEQKVADSLIEACVSAVDYWSSRWLDAGGKEKSYSIDRLRVFLEILARLTVRASVNKAKENLKLAYSLGSNKAFQHHILFDSLNNLINYSIQSIPASSHHELLLDSLLFPLMDEVGLNKRWPNPVIKVPGVRIDNIALNRRLEELIEAISTTTQSSAVFLRLLPLLENKFLNAEERTRIAEKLWGKQPDYNNLPQFGLLKYVLLELPCDDFEAVKNTVRRFLFEAKGDSLFESALLFDIYNAAKAEGAPEYPDPDQAISYFSRLVAWRPQEKEDPLGFSQREDRQKASFIGLVLAHSVVPALPIEYLTDENFKKLQQFYADVKVSEVLIAFSYFSARVSVYVDLVEKLFRRGLQCRDRDDVVYSSCAILKWKELDSKSLAAGRLVSRLIYSLGSYQMFKLSDLLFELHKVLKSGHVDDADLESLAEVVALIFDNSSYEAVSPVSSDAASVSLVRAACVKLAERIVLTNKVNGVELERILQEAVNDPLPEVRFAVQNT